VAILVWIALIGVIRLLVLPWFRQGPNGDAVTGALWRVVRMYAWFVPRTTFVGMDRLRQTIFPGPMIVVSNHTGAVDPLLVQAGCSFHIRWMMASEMMAASLDWLWHYEKPIPVDRDGKDSGPAREAIRHVLAGGIVGIFPEGRIVQPPRQLRPFFQGVGLIVARSKAPVLLVWVSGTPDTTHKSESLSTPSHARVENIEMIDFKNERDAHVIAQKLRNRLAQHSGWPKNDEPQPPAEDEEEI
jgi:1-acyl-sn-glycerol-3-phosphate acyltransferase